MRGSAGRTRSRAARRSRERAPGQGLSGEGRPCGDCLLRGPRTPGTDGWTSPCSWFLWGVCCSRLGCGRRLQGPPAKGRDCSQPRVLALAGRHASWKVPGCPALRKVPESWARSRGKAALLWATRWPRLLGTPPAGHTGAATSARGDCSPLALGQLRVRLAHETLMWPRLWKVWESGEARVAFGHVLPLP